ncbi:hypothetical protein ACWEK5_47965 [Rhodococcus koreensis]
MPITSPHYHVAASTIALIVYDKTIVLVSSITGRALHRGGLAILGEPLTDHPSSASPTRCTHRTPAHGVINSAVERSGREPDPQRIRPSPRRPSPIPLPRTAS